MITIINSTNHHYIESYFHRKDVHIINTRELKIKHCSGCFSCWVKTPGVCIQQDDMPMILDTIMQSDLVIFLADIKMGLVDSELKKIHDKMIPLVLPYIRLIHGELHHEKRYDSYPDVALAIINNEELTEEVFTLNQRIYERFALNFHSKLVFTLKDQIDLKEIENEINNY